MGAYWVVVVIGAPMLLWAAIAPQSQWRTLAAWRFRNPQAVEPSELAYQVQRGFAVITLVGMVLLGFAFESMVDDPEVDPLTGTVGDSYISDCDLSAPSPLC